MNSPAQSIHTVIVNYNAGDWLARCLQSAIAHTQGTISVVDNNSTDTSVSKARNLFPAEPRLDWKINQVNKGFAAANNQALTHLRSDFVLLLNPDCELNADTIPVMLQAFADDSELGLASCLIYNQDGTVQATCRRRFPTPWSALVRMLQLHRLFPRNPRFANFDYGELDEANTNTNQVEKVEAISGAFMMLRTKALREIGNLDEGFFMHCEDLDWCKRFEKSEWHVGFVREASILHAKGVSSRSRPIKVLWSLHAGMNRFFNKHYYSDYSWWLRWMVKIGIGMNFLMRCAGSLLNTVIAKK